MENDSGAVHRLWIVLFCKKKSERRDTCDGSRTWNIQGASGNIPYIAQHNLWILKVHKRHAGGPFQQEEDHDFGSDPDLCSESIHMSESKT